MNEIKIVEKRSNMHNQKPVKTDVGYTISFVYVLEDGMEIQDTNTMKYLNWAKKELLKMPYDPKFLYAKFDDEGKYLGVKPKLKAKVTNI